jgi:CRISPR type II-A-associated protein Csn2
VKLVNTKYNIGISFEENTVNVVYIENTDCFTSLIANLYMQCDGKIGTWILSEADKEFAISKEVELVINPLAVNCNDKRILKALYQSMENTIRENCFDVYSDINARILNFLDEIIGTEPYPIEISLEVAPADLLKLYDVRFCMEHSSLCEQLISYIKIWHQVGHVDIFAFVNLKSYLSDEQYASFCEVAFYEKINLLLFESRYNDRGKLDFEVVQIVDKDLCIINL